MDYVYRIPTGHTALSTTSGLRIAVLYVPDAVFGALVRFLENIGPFLTAGYYFIIYIEWAKIDLWAFTVFFEAMILK